MTDSQRQAHYKYKKTHLKRVPLDLKLEEYQEVKEAAEASGESVNGYIKKAIRLRLNRPGQGRAG